MVCYRSYPLKENIYIERETERERNETEIWSYLVINIGRYY